MTEAVAALIALVIGGFAVWLVMRARPAPDTPAARAEVKQAEDQAHKEAQAKAAEVIDAPSDVVASDVERMRERGRAGK